MEGRALEEVSATNKREKDEDNFIVMGGDRKGEKVRKEEMKEVK